MTSEASPIRVLVVGCGNMGRSHAISYHNSPGFEIVGLVSRGADSREELNRTIGGKLDLFGDYGEALATTRPDAVCISTYPDTHVDYALQALQAGAHVFLEKPIALTVADATRVVAAARESSKKLVIGYILHHHPSWTKFVEIARELGKPLVMRMNLNQQSHGKTWHTHKQLMQSMSPIVDCGVHYVDMMCRMTRSRPTQVSAIGARLSDELPHGMYNYGQLQVRFEDESVGWYEAGWGPMMSQEAFFIKDVIGPKGCASIVGVDGKVGSSDSVDGHSLTNRIRHHRAATNADGSWKESDVLLDTTDEPDHQGLCDLEQAFFLQAIREDMDLREHLDNAVDSLRIVLAADESVRTGKTVLL